MKHYTFLVLMVALSQSSLSAGEQPDSGEINFEAGLSFLSRYVRRGFDLNGRKPALQPSLRISLPEGFSVDFLGSFGIDNRTQLDEADLILSYQTDLIPEAMTMSLAFSSYQYLGTESDIYQTGGTDYANGQEITVTFETVSLPATISLEYGRGLGGKNGGEIIGNYASITIGKDLDMNEVTFGFGLSTSYLDQYEIPNKIIDVSLRNECSVSISDVTVHAGVDVVYLLSPDLLNGNNEHVIVPIELNVSFSW